MAQYVAAAFVVGAVASPLLVPLALNAAGFGVAGILAGSPAATFMASYGGTVASGSLCASLQGLGAGGLGATGHLVAAAVGGGVGGGVAATVQGVATVFEAFRKKGTPGDSSSPPPPADSEKDQDSAAAATTDKEMLPLDYGAPALLRNEGTAPGASSSPPTRDSEKDQHSNAASPPPPVDNEKDQDSAAATTDKEVLLVDCGAPALRKEGIIPGASSPRQPSPDSEKHQHSTAAASPPPTDSDKDQESTAAATTHKEVLPVDYGAPALRKRGTGPRASSSPLLHREIDHNSAAATTAMDKEVLLMYCEAPALSKDSEKDQDSAAAATKDKELLPMDSRMNLGAAATDKEVSPVDWEAPAMDLEEEEDDASYSSAWDLQEAIYSLLLHFLDLLRP